MAKVTLKVVAKLTPAQIRRLNPHLKRKGLTIEKAINRGLKKRIPLMYLNATAFLAAIEGFGLSFSNKRGGGKVK